MPKNKGMGGKNFKRVKGRGDAVEKELVLKEAGQEYAQVIKVLGNGRIEASCFDGKTRLCLIRGKLHNRVWIGLEDLILVGLRDYQDDKADVLLKYSGAEARQLKFLGQLPKSVIIKGEAGLDKEDIVFEDPEIGNNEAPLPSSSSSEQGTKEGDTDDEEKEQTSSSH